MPVRRLNLVLGLALPFLTTQAIHAADAVVAAAAAGEQVSLAGTWKGLMTTPLSSAKSNATSHADPGLTVQGATAMAPATVDQEWQDFPVPTPWSRYGGAWAASDGEAVFRRRFSVPATWLGQPLELHLGAIDDFDLTQVNGVTVGSTDNRQPGSWTFKRVYRIPAGLLHPGDNLLCIRVFDRFGEGGMMGPPSDLFICPLPPVPPADGGSAAPVSVVAVPMVPATQPGTTPIKDPPAR